MISTPQKLPMTGPATTGPIQPEMESHPLINSTPSTIRLHYAGYLGLGRYTAGMVTATAEPGACGEGVFS
jgi:hypothetical protein